MQIARRCMRGEKQGHSLQATALVNEAYLKLIDAQQMNWQNRTHFLAVSAMLMRRILVDHARKKGYQKRGGGDVKVPWDSGIVVPDERGPVLVALDQHHAILSTASDRVVEQTSSLSDVRGNLVGPQDEDVVELPVLCAMYRGHRSA